MKSSGGNISTIKLSAHVQQLNLIQNKYSGGEAILYEKVGTPGIGSN
jgi:hypothetical protein